MLCTLDVSVKTSFYIKIYALVSIKRKTNRMSKLISKGANKKKEDSWLSFDKQIGRFYIFSYIVKII